MELQARRQKAIALQLAPILAKAPDQLRQAMAPGIAFSIVHV
jgi:hypothetical protein